MPTITITRALQARNLLSLAIQGSTISTVGVVTFGTAIELAVANTGTNTFDAFELRLGPQMEKFVPADASVASYQIEHEDFTATIRELSPQTSIGGSMTQFLASDYIRVVAKFGAPGAASAAQTQVVLIGIRESAQYGIQLGRNTQELVLRPCGYTIFVGAGNATPTI
jgi:hypothetical protein